MSDHPYRTMTPTPIRPVVPRRRPVPTTSTEPGSEVQNKWLLEWSAERRELEAFECHLATAEAALKAVTDEKARAFVERNSWKEAAEVARSQRDSAVSRGDRLELMRVDLKCERDSLAGKRDHLTDELFIANGKLAAMTSRAEKAEHAHGGAIDALREAHERAEKAERDARNLATQTVGVHFRPLFEENERLGAERDAAIAAKDKAEANAAAMASSLAALFRERAADAPKTHKDPYWQIVMHVYKDAALECENYASDAGASILARLKAAEEERNFNKADAAVAHGEWRGTLERYDELRAQLAERDAEIGRLRAADSIVRALAAVFLTGRQYTECPEVDELHRRARAYVETPIAEDSARKEGG